MRLCPPARKSRPQERGYVLITLILFVALLAISLTALAPAISQQIKRDREEELVHRGTQYSRAIKRYMKKFNRYPTRIEDLENTNNVHYLRKRYKDPVTGKDFKLIHLGEAPVSFAPGLAGANPAASLAAGAAAAGNSLGGGAATPFGGSGVFGGGPTGNSGGNAGGAFGGNSGGAFGGNSGGAFGGASGGAFGGGNSPFGGGTPGQTSNPPDASNANQAPGTPGSQGGFGQPLQQLPGFNQQGTGNQVFGGGPIVGVASVSTDKTIRIYNKKEHYNEWQFIYDANSDRGGLLTTPYQSPVQTASQNLNGASGSKGTAGGAPASPFSFGGGPQNPPGGMTPTPQPSPYPQQPQMPPDQGPQ